MANIREMQAVFRANADRMQSTVKRVKDDFEGLKKKTDEVAKSIGDNIYKGFDKMQRGGEKIKGVAGGVSKYLTTPIVAAGAAAIASGSSFEQSATRIQNALGLTEKEAKRLTETSRRIYKDGFGNSVEEVDYAILQVKQNIKDLNDQELEKVTRNALVLADAFDADVNEVTRAGQNIIKGFGVEADVAFDLMAHGAQNGLNFSNEMFDNLSEYAPLFGKMGFSAEEYFDLLIKGSEAGVYNLDYINDVFKEFQVRVKDGSDATSDAMAGLSGETQNVWKEFLKGNGTVKDVSNAVLSELEGMDNQVKANEIGVQLFGTKWEDLEADAMYAMGGIDGGLKDIDGSMQKMSDNLEESPLQRMTAMWRELKGALAPIGITLLEMAEDWIPKVTTAIQAVSNWFGELTKQQREWMVILGLIGAAIGPLLMVIGQFAIWLGGLGKAVTTLLPDLGEKGLKGALKTLVSRFSFLMGPIGIAIGIITTLGIAFVTAYNKSESFRNFIGSIGGRIKGAIGWLRDFKNGIAGLFQDDGTGGVDILTSIGISEGMATRLNDMVGKFFEFKRKVEGVINDVKTAAKGIFAIFQGDHTSANEILRSIGLSEETINSIFLAVANIKSAFRTTKEYVTNILSAVGIFLRAKIAEIVTFWQSDGQQILQATKNIFSGVSAAISGAIRFIVPIIRTGLNVAWSIFKFVWPAILGLIKMVWGNIKGVINGGLKFIQGLIQVFSGIFTGDFRKMWQGVKNIFSGAIQFVWNLFQLMFYGRIIKGVASLVKIFAGSIRSLWTRVVSFFKSMGEGAALRVMYMRDAVVKFIVNLARRAGNAVSGMVQSIGRFFKNLYTGVTNRVVNMKNAVVNRFLQLKNGAVNNIKALYESVRAWFKNIYDNVSTRMRNAKNRAVNFARDMKDGVIEKFKALSNGARDMMDNVGKWIDRKKQAVINKATSLGTDIANAAIKGFNKLIGGINKVGSMLGIDELLNKIPLIGSGGGGSRRGSGGYAPTRYSTGTSYHRGGPAIVGDKGPGNGGGTSEIVSLPNGRNWLFNKETLIDDLPTGAKVLNNRKTEKKFGAGSGTDKDSKNSWFSSAKDWVSNKASSIVGGISGAYNKVSNFVSDIWDYMKNPGELASKLVSNLDLGFDLPPTALDLAKGGVKKLTSHIGTFFGKWFDSAGGEVDGGSILNRRITAKFGRYPAAIARQLGVTKHYGLDTAHKYEKLISPVTGKVTRVWHDKFGGNSIQIKSGKAHWWFMHMQSIARQVGDMVKAGKTALGITGNTGLRTTGYHLHSQKMVGGIGNKYAVDPLPDLKKAKGYFKGGITSGIPELAWLNEEGFKESIISWNPARKERSEDIWRQTGSALGFNGNDNKEELSLLREQNKLLAGILGVNEEHKEVSEGILDKEPRIVLDEFKRKFNRHNDDRTIMT